LRMVKSYMLSMHLLQINGRQSSLSLQRQQPQEH